MMSLVRARAFRMLLIAGKPVADQGKFLCKCKSKWPRGASDLWTSIMVVIMHGD